MSGQVQLGLPADISVNEIARKSSLGGAIQLCAEAAGYELDKTLQIEMDVDKAQFSRWLSGTEGIIWDKLRRLMDLCGNDAPVLWQLHQRGYDLNSLRKRETETERKLRLAEERIRELEIEKKHFAEFLKVTK
jgi:hypothetical protein